MESIDDYEPEYIYGDSDPEFDVAPKDPPDYEYLDHTADVQIHAWGDTLAEAFENAANAMFGYMTTIARVDMHQKVRVRAKGHDLDSLLFNFLHEWLYAFSTEPFFIARKVKVTSFREPSGDSADDEYAIEAHGYGEEFDPYSKHDQGTEVKAITYSNLQIYRPGQDDPTNAKEGQHLEHNALRKMNKAEVFVVIDI